MLPNGRFSRLAELPNTRCLSLTYLPCRSNIVQLLTQVSEPEKWVDAMADAGVSQFIFHIEATQNPVELIESIKAKGMKV